MRERVMRKINSYKRKLVSFLLGESLLIKKRECDNSCFYELINTKSHINFGRFKAIKCEERQSDESVVTFFVILKS